MENETKEKSVTNWWQTVPGILTAVAALITATGGLLLVMNQIGCLDKSIKSKTESVQTPFEKNELNTNKTEISDNSDKSNSEKKNVETEIKKYPFDVEKITDVKMGENSIKFLQTSVDNYSTGKHSLTFKIRFNNKSSNYASFNQYYFRLIFDEQILSPENSPVGSIDPVSSKDAEAVFIIPDTLKSAELQISYIYDEKQTTKFPVKLN